MVLSFLHKSCQWDFVCFAEEENTDKEHNGKCSYTQIYAAGNLADHGYNHCSRKGSALAADIVNPKVFAGFICRDDLYKIRP